ncbi:MAG: VOC family protein, partial [Actinomycetota bacterium]
DNQAEEAAKFYVSVFNGRPGAGNSKILEVSRYGDAGPGEPGSVMVVRFMLDGQEFNALNGGDEGFRFNESLSFVIDCEDQDEVDHFWRALTADGGQEGPCGWLKDKYGLSWQVTPRELIDLLRDPDPGRAQRAMAAMLQMKKIDIGALRRAAGAA